MSDSQLGEPLNVILDRVQEMREDWDNRLTFPPTKLGERYLKGKVHLQLICRGWGKDFLVNVRSSDDCPLKKLEGNRKAHVPTALNEHECLVFVYSVKVVEDDEWIIKRVRSIIGLEFLDQAPSVGRSDSLNLSVVTGEFLWLPRFCSADRECNQSLVLPPILLARQKPNEMVQDRTQMVGDFPGKNTEARRDLPPRVLQEFMRSLFFVLTENTFRWFQERLDLGIEVTDAVIGPI